MIRSPQFETTLVIGDDAGLLAEISSFFHRDGRYLAVCDGPRMARPDHDNEVIRRGNIIARIRPKCILFAGLPPDAAAAQAKGLPPARVTSVSSRHEAAQALKGLVRPRVRELRWPPSNLGIGLLLARQSNSALVIDSSCAPRSEIFVSGGRHVLVVCETSEDISHVIAANLAFSIGASFIVIPELPKADRREWLEHLYLLGSREQVVTFDEIARRARAMLPAEIVSGRYKEIIFVTSEFPWGIAVHECPTSHLYAYPEFGRFVGDGIWACNNPSTSARNALLINPGEVDASEIEVIKTALNKNKSLVRVMRGGGASVHLVDAVVQSIPFDIIAISTHAGDWHGQRLTYEYFDREGRLRRLVVDEAVGFGYDPTTDLYLVQTFYSFRSLDGVAWDDDEGKQRLPVGSAILSWNDFASKDRRTHLVAQEKIGRVRGAMAMKMFDHVWMVGGRGVPSVSTVLINNACSSFHQLSSHFVFGGVRTYIGTLFQITDAEAQEVNKYLFINEMGSSLAEALWKAQRAVYGDQTRRPYVMVGLPFCRILPNKVDSVKYLRQELVEAIGEYEKKAQQHPDEGVRRNSATLKNHLVRELDVLDREFQLT